MLEPVAVAALSLVAACLAIAVPLLLLRVPPAVPVAIYAFVLPWGSAVALPAGPDPFNTLSTLAGLAATFPLLLRVAVSWRQVPQVQASVVAWTALVGWLMLTLLWSVSPSSTIKALAVLLSLIALFVLASLVQISPPQLRWIALGSVGGGLVVAVQALLTTARGGLDQTSSRLPRFTYADGDPNILAASLHLPLALALWWALTARGRLQRSVGAAAGLAMFGAIVVTGSRGGVLAALVVLVVVVVTTPGIRVARLSGYLVGLVLMLALFLLALPEGLRSHLSETDSTGRGDIWRVGLQACVSACHVGSGYGSFGSVYRQMYLDDLSLAGFGDRPFAAHNAFLSMAVEAGVPGLLLMLLALGLLMRSLLRLPRRTSGAALGAFAGLVTSNMLVSNLGFKYFWMSLLYATLVVSTSRRAAQPHPDDVPAPARVLATL